MTQAERLAALHSTAFDGASRWSAAAFASALHNPKCFFVYEGADPDGFALGRTVADEAELLTLAVAAPVRRRGLGTRLLSRFETEARSRGATAAFLEVSADNAAARALYDRAGWQLVGQRTGYYEGTDALTMRKHF
ncbi:ribosomal protein S18-alanine N-acetyltransferase [Jannaschia seohaensis]|uniref:[Ribosomal protein bS18]-alanine N-acetyltransferase n=1 Tax=Jannaschia seohaensis TaxID=475081 RepID=A0A2Y9A3H0_9RHOB|nr:ribosomal protein S18-alanine N-acetyltransferase [Jannaschia seohaensis]PWJ22118.1 ribosomal-protein-alanine N-acetyltransferase [Jannaschia seohaensis]SSA38396.1 ribosomal-protein-alanine N-acetyltransferase [Jannaschia seohaensis]